MPVQMSLITGDGVYLITNVAYPKNYLIHDSNQGKNVVAVSTSMQCWRLKQNTKTGLWTLRAIVSEYEHHFNYGGEGGSYLVVPDEAGKSTHVADGRSWLALELVSTNDEWFVPCQLPGGDER